MIKKGGHPSFQMCAYANPQVRKGCSMTKKQVLFVLLFLSVLFLSVSSHWLLLRLGILTPAWLGPLLALACLFGMLSVFWRSGALRARFVLAFVGVLLLAPVVTWLLLRT